MSITRRIPTSAERLAVVATGGYGRGELAPGSDIDLLFVRPFKQTAWGESVIEFILYMLWDLGLKVGHATRSLAECVRLAKQDITIRTALLEARYLWGDNALYEELRKRFWTEVATGNGQDFVEAKLAERDERHRARAKAAIWSSPTSRKARAGCAICRRSTGSANISITSTTRPIWSKHNVFTARRIQAPSRRPRPFCGTCACICIICWARRRSGCPSTCSRNWRRALGYRDADKPRRAVEAFMRAYFLVAKDVGDLTRIFCAALEEQNRKKRRPSLRRDAAGLSQAAHAAATISMSRTGG